MKPRVLVIVLCYNGVDLTLACLASLARLTYGPVSVLVVDNASSDGTPVKVKALFPDVSVVETGANLGYAAGNNVGLRYALEHGYHYALLLNNDTEVSPDFLTHLVNVCEADTSIGVVGPKIYYHDRPDTLWSAGGVIDWAHGTTYMRGRDSVDTGQFDEQVDMHFVTGCALLVRRAVLVECGLLDERFGMYFEETEWCVRVNRAGWRLVYVPSSRIWHKIRPAAQEQSPSVMYYMPRNRLLFLRLTGAPLSTWIHALLLQDFKHWCSWFLPRNRSGSRVKKAALEAAWRDFLFGRFGMLR